MAEVNHLLGIAVGAQSVSGTADATIAALSGALDETDGLVLGDPSAGIGESGITFELEGNRRDKAVVTNSFTKQAGDFLGENVVTLDIAVPLKGNGYASPTLDAHYTPDPGIVALWRAAGMTGAGHPSATGWQFTPTSSGLVTCKVWVGSEGTNSLIWILKDCEGSVSVSFPPGDVAVATFSLSATVDSFSEAATPTFDYGNQGSLSAPAVESVANIWSAVRGFSTATLSIDSEQENILDSNAAGGSRDRQTGRDVQWTGTLFGDDVDFDFERSELVRTTAPTAPLIYTVGTAGGSTANAIRLTMLTPEVRKWAVNKLGPSYAVDVVLRAVNATANNELSIDYL